MLREVIEIMGAGAVAYGLSFPFAFELSKPLEKAALVTLLVGTQYIVRTMLHKSRTDANGVVCLTNLSLFGSLAGVGYFMKFKPTDYLVLAGLTTISRYTVTILDTGYKWAFSGHAKASK